MIGIVSRMVALAVIVSGVLTGCVTRRADHVFIVSIDGGSPAVMQRSPMPALQKLVREGAHSWTAQTIRPSVTLPAHTSMLTGVRMEKHGVFWNTWSPTNGLVSWPTVFTLARQSGHKTAMFVGKEKFRHLLQPDSVDQFDYDRAHSVVLLRSESGGRAVKKEGNVMTSFVAARAADHIIEQKPNLCFIHLTDPDTVGHEFGWDSPEQIKSLADVDAGLNVLVQAIRQAGIAKRSVILISADHGGHGKGHSQGTPADMTIPWIAWGRGVKPGFAITAPVNTCDTAATALWLLGLKPRTPLDGTPVTSAFQ